MTKLTTKPDSMQPATEMAVNLFDNWFDPIETEVRARARQFIEELIRGELDTALAQPRYERSKMAGNEAGACVTGHRHGSRNYGDDTLDIRNRPRPIAPRPSTDRPGSS